MLNQIIQIAKEAGEIILSYYRSDAAFSLKGDKTPLTKADLAANQKIVSALCRLTPDIPVISEEASAPSYGVRKKWKRFWLVDPLDGTKEFLSRQDEFTVNIALIDGGVPVLGVIYAPALGLLYYAQQGKGAWRMRAGGKPVKIFSKHQAKGPYVILESRLHTSPDLEEYLQQIKVKKRLKVGSSLKFCYLAEGKGNLYPRFGPTMEWDVAAGDCIFRNATKRGFNKSPFVYNQRDLRNANFILGAEAASA